MTYIIYPELSYDVQGALFEVHNTLRHFGLSESGWERALAIALSERGIVAHCQVEFALLYKGRRVGRFFVDVIAEREGQVLLELKKTALEAVHKAKVIAYLRVTDIKLGILVTFGGERVEFQRIPNRVSECVIPGGYPAPPSSFQALDPYLAQVLWPAFCEVRRELGPGFMHMHYRRACQVELRLSQVPFEKINEIVVQFRGQPIERRKVSLLLVDGRLLVVALAVLWITPGIVSRYRQYLKLLGVNQGLIVNFRPAELETVVVNA
jgi:GxxExxY protein